MAKKKSAKEESSTFHNIIAASESDKSWRQIHDNYATSPGTVPRENALIEFKHKNTLGVIETGAFLPFNNSHFFVKTENSDRLLLNSEYFWRLAK
jgi:hypothetical protein